MKKVVFAAIVLLAASLVMVPMHAMAKNGERGRMAGDAKPSCENPPGKPDTLPPRCGVDFSEGTPFEISGAIVGIVFPNGLEVMTEQGSIIVRGLPPLGLWDDLGIAAPTIGETAVISGVVATGRNGDEHYVAFDIVTGGIEIQLRDPESGEPAWEVRGPRERPEPITDILSGEPFKITGVVAAIMNPQGIEVETADGTLTLFGIGPLRFWDEIGVAPPEIGDTVVATGYAVDYEGLERYIVMTIAVNGEEEVELRDPDTGAPLWRRPPPLRNGVEPDEN